MLIFGPAAGPRISAVTWYPPSSALSLITWPPSTMSTAGSVTVEPISPASLSTVRTSSTDALSCLPPQRTIAYTKELSLPGASLPWELDRPQVSSDTVTVNTVSVQDRGGRVHQQVRH